MRPVLLALLATGCSSDFQVKAAKRELVVTPALSDLGTVPVGAEQPVELTLSAPNGEVSVLAVDLLNVEGEYFTLTDDSLPTVPAEGSATLTLSYAPTAEGLHWATVTVQTDEDTDSSHEVIVRGEAAEAAVRVYPTLLDLGPVAAGSAASDTVTLVNEGRVDLTLSAVSLTNAGFALTDTLPLDLAAGESLELGFSYSATDTTEATAIASFDLGAYVTADEVDLRANACESGSGDLYDGDDDRYSFCNDDCDDWDASVHPGADETCDGMDQDCDGSIDEGTSCVDDDGDGWSEDEGDCNDGDDDVSPGFTEIDGNGIDDDCDGVADDGAVDDDGDGYSTAAGDCDDADASAFPGASEAADGEDDDCDGTTDEGTDLYDDDSDGYNETDGDCDDTDAAVKPYATETANWTDDDCDGTVDEGTSYYDDDGDGYSEAGGDCDDTDAEISPAELEVTGDGIDNDCTGGPS